MHYNSYNSVWGYIVFKPDAPEVCLFVFCFLFFVFFFFEICEKSFSYDRDENMTTSDDI